MTAAVQTRTRGGYTITTGTGLLAASGVLLVALYAVASARIPIPRYFPSAQITLDFVKMLGPTWQHTTLLYVGTVGLAFALYALALAAVWRMRHVPPLVLFGFPVLFAVALAPMYPPTAMDMFHYHAMARVFAVFDANPLITRQDQFPYPIGMSWWDMPSPYGPLWSWLAGSIAVVTGDHFLLGLFSLKAAAALAYMGSTWVIWRLVKETRPGDETLAVVLFAWNPFVVLRVIGNGHNDMWMLGFALLALAATYRRMWTTAVLLLTVSVLFKYVSALLGPPLLLYIWTHAEGDYRARAAVIAKAGAASLALTALAYARFWAGLETFEVIRNQTTLMITSTPVLLFLILSPYMDAERAQEYARIIPTVTFLALYLPLTWQARRSFDHLVVMSFTAFFLYLVVVAAWFRPWYMLWPVAFAALRPREWLGVLLIVITLTASFHDLVEQFRSYWPWLGTYQRQAVAPIALGFFPPLVAWLYAVALKNGWSLGADDPRPAEAGP